jgi:drug/metabolite transporter (DMT)-like permease
MRPLPPRPPASPHPPWLSYACLALSMSLVGSYVALSKPLAAAIPVLLLAWLRFGLAAIAMLPWLIPTPTDRPLDRRTHGLLFLESFLGNFLFSMCMLYGVSLTGAVAAGIVMAGIPATVAVLSWLWLGERVTKRTWLAIGLAMGGMGLLALAHHETGASPAPITAASPQHALLSSTWDSSTGLGYVLLAAAVLCEAAYAVIGKTLATSVPPKRITAIINLWGFGLTTPLGLWTAWQFDFGQITTSVGALLVFYTLAASVWSVWLWMTGLREVPAARAGVFTACLPVSAAVIGVGVLGEPMTRWHGAALVLALLGVIIATTTRPHRPGS